MGAIILYYLLFFTSLLNFFTKAPVRFVRVELFVWDELMQFFRRWNEKGEEVGEKRCCNIWKNSQWMILLNWKIKKCVPKKKYYNVLQQPSALLEKIFYVLTQFLVCFFPNFFTQNMAHCANRWTIKETRYWKRKCNKTWLINRKFLLFLYFFSENLAKYYIFFWHLPRLIMRERQIIIFFAKLFF